MGASIVKMSRLLKISRSGYYDWLHRPQGERAVKDNLILNAIRGIHNKHSKWGLDAIWHEVMESIACCRSRVHKLMKRNGIHSERKAKWKATTNSHHKLPVAENLLLRERSEAERINSETGKKLEKYERIFTFKEPNKVWVGDITYNWTDEGWLYTAIVKDLCTKEVVGFSMSDRIDRHLVIAAMEMAIGREHPPRGLIFHSDKGAQYCSGEYRNLLHRHGIIASMSRTGNPYDNAVAENFFSNMKCECTNFCHFKTRNEARMTIFQYIAIEYNRVRRHSGLGWLTPAAFKHRLRAAVKCK
jgi:putative transposase